MIIAKSQVCCGAPLETRNHSFTALKQECVSSWVYGRGRNKLRRRLCGIALPLPRRARLHKDKQTMFAAAGFARVPGGFVPASHSHPERKVRPSLAQAPLDVLA